MREKIIDLLYAENVRSDCGIERLADEICAINSVKKGKWIKQNPLVDTEECSECGYNILSEEFETPFCPWCGADMKGEENETN